MIVMRSRFFSIMLVPLCEEYIDEAIASEIPVPLPLCIKIKITRPVPERNNKTSKIIAIGDISHP